MLSAIENGNGVAKSPFVIAMKNLDIPFLPDLVNAVVITSAWSCTNCLLFQASRAVFGLAKHGRAPTIFAKATKSGVPLPALILSIAVASLAFMTCNTASAKVFNWFINLGSTAIMIAYILKLVANLRFHAGLRAQGRDLNSNPLPFKSRLTPYSNYFALLGVGLILLTNGYGVFINGYWSFQDFFTAYFTIVLYLVIYLGWKIIKKTKFVRATETDLATGLREVEEHEVQLITKEPATRYERFMDFLW
ncbi:putative general amino acid permease [Phaeomoniella chlamydospora]|uniref:Putative general amino acid permease n=1 Tax=Phaeomoniella chlamydospora TaxID=158046 RepID=A0A0G2E6L9_PHACM|nr:putative general amino acid permease [Phaeomoniella chlamydospora]